MQVFDDLERTYLGPAAFAEGSFSYYNRSARPEVARVRRLIEDWVALFPEDARAELTARLRKDHGSFKSAFFEAYVHALLVRLGHEVVLHPELVGTAKRPDFLATPRTGGEPIIVECVVADAEGGEARTEQDLLDRVQDALNEFRHPDFSFVLTRLEGRSAGFPRKAALHAFLRDAVSGIDYEELSHRVEAGESVFEMKRHRLELDGLLIEVCPYPKSSSLRGNLDGRAIGAGPIRELPVNAREVIRTAIKGKAGRYGDLPHPFVIAVNCAGRWGVNDDDVREGLFGAKVPVPGPGGKVRFAISGEGALTHRGRPSNTRISAVLAARDLAPPHAATADVRLYHHIAAKRPYEGSLDLLQHTRVAAGRLHHHPAVLSLSALFGLPPGWPY